MWRQAPGRGSTRTLTYAEETLTDFVGISVSGGEAVQGPASEVNFWFTARKWTSASPWPRGGENAGGATSRDGVTSHDSTAWQWEWLVKNCINIQSASPHLSQKTPTYLPWRAPERGSSCGNHPSPSLSYYCSPLPCHVCLGCP